MVRTRDPGREINRLKKSQHQFMWSIKTTGGGNFASVLLGVGRILWLRRVRLENPLDRRNFLCGLKSSGECNGVLGLVWFRAVRPLNDIMGICTAWLELWARVGISK